jgi:beta-glucanase (GH16 family)
MSKLAQALCTLSCLLGLASPAHAAGWELVFSDEFEGSELDRQKWATRYIYENELCDTFPKNEERQRYADHDNHVLRDGALGLVARKVKPQGKLDFESGLIRSYQTFYYGYYEARVKTPRAIGTWPAFWLAVDRDKDGDITWPPEIDIFDNANNGKDATGKTIYSGGVDSDDGDGPQGGKLHWGTKGVDKKGVYYGSKDLTGQWHVYGMLWTPTKLTLWLDGKMIFVKNYKWVDNEGKVPGPAHVLMNLAVGGPWAGRFGIDEKAFPQTFLVDYVRVCQLSDAGTAGRSCGGSPFTPDPVKYAYQSEIGGDLPRPMISDAVLSAPSARAGTSVEIEHQVAATVSTRETHGLYQYLVNARGDTVGWGRVELPTPSTQWAGKTLKFKTRLNVPQWAEPGAYRVFIAIGKPEEWDAEGKVSLQSINLRYAPDAKHRERIGQPARWKVGELRVVQ